MKTFLVIAIIGATLGASYATASQSSNSGRNTFETLQIQDSALHTVVAAREAFKSVRGLYALDDGTNLRLYQDGSTYFAEVSGREPFEVVAKKNGNFVAVNGTAEFRFMQNAGGLVAKVVVVRQG